MESGSARTQAGFATSALFACSHTLGILVLPILVAAHTGAGSYGQLAAVDCEGGVGGVFAGIVGGLLGGTGGVFFGGRAGGINAITRSRRQRIVPAAASAWFSSVCRCCGSVAPSAWPSSF